MATLRLFAAAREAAGTSVETVAATTVGAVLDDARRRHGEGFAAVLAQCKVWLNGEPADPETPSATATRSRSCLRCPAAPSRSRPPGREPG